MRFIITKHAEERMAERGVKAKHIAQAIKYGKRKACNRVAGNWIVFGKRQHDGRHLCVSLSASSEVITVFWK